ncbi:MAG: Fic family protein [Defluviitaleaceae bacterium]|nr:Fic family protein [Defluviitaleaceae bacterium]
MSKHDPYLYDDVDVLKNKLGIKDGELLAKREVDITCRKIHQITETPIEGDYDFKHFCEFHAKIFNAVYEWAGLPRTVTINKAEKSLAWQSIEYTKPSNIESEATIVLQKMASLDWDSMNTDEKATELSRSMADLWKIHPFREGNTRTTITFVCQFAESKGIFLKREIFEKNAAYMRAALVAASAKFADIDLRQPEHLFKIVRDSIERGETF